MEPLDEPEGPPKARRRIVSSRMFLVSTGELVKLALLAATAGFLLGRWW